MTTGNTVRSVERAIDVLEIIMGNTAALSLTEISDRVGLHPSTTQRLLLTLEARNFIHRDPETKLYVLGSKLIFPATGYNLRNIALPFLEKVTKKCGEITSFAIRSGNQATYIAQASSGRPVNMFVQTGSLVPLHCTGVGKTILANLNYAEVLLIVGDTGLEAYTPNTIINIDLLSDDLDLIKKRGYAIDDEEREVGIRCLAAPIFFSDGTILGAISISGPTGRVTPKKDEWFTERLIKNAARLSSMLGYHEGASKIYTNIHQ